MSTVSFLTVIFFCVKLNVLVWIEHRTVITALETTFTKIEEC